MAEHGESLTCFFFFFECDITGSFFIINYCYFLFDLFTVVLIFLFILSLLDPKKTTQPKHSFFLL